MIQRSTLIVCLVLLLMQMAAGTAAGLSLVYEVRRGDSLWSIARRFKMPIEEIKRLNELKGDRVYPGQILKLGRSPDEIAAPNGPYYWRKPRVSEQQSRGYRERSTRSPLEDYRRARVLLKAFDAEIQSKRSRDRRRRLPLDGWKIVLDPGHGGMDPGAIVSNRAGNAPVYVVEDEYVYDIALRMYERLGSLGADVMLTVISPNHLIRENLQAVRTFVHEQNEVYNDERINRRPSERVRPGGRNLTQRVRITNRFLKRARKGRSLFVSLHADNSPQRPKGPLAIYLSRKGKVDHRSRRFAQIVRKALEQPNLPAQLKGRNLGVLRNNRAHAEILVEIRNVHDMGEAWALRFHKNRQRDADRIVNGILSYVKGR